MIDKVIELIGPAITTLSEELLSLNMLLIVIAGMVLTWTIKVSLKYSDNKPKNWMIIWVLSPLSACIPSLMIWPGDWKADLVVGLAAAFMSSTAWWFFINKVAYTVKPDWVDQLDNPWANTPIDRRKSNRGKIVNDRRKK